MIEFEKQGVINPICRTLVITYPRQVVVHTGIYPYPEDIHNLLIEIKNNIDPDVSYVSNVKGRMTSWHHFKDHPLIIKYLHYVINTQQRSNHETFKHFYEKYVVSQAWGNELRKGEYVKPHSHSCLHGILYLTEGAPLIVPDLTLKIHPRAGDYIILPPELPHYVSEHTSDASRFSIIFNAEEKINKASWDKTKRIEDKFELEKTK